MDLQSNPQTTHGCPLAHYVVGNWDTYLQSMGQQGTYGDHITLQRAFEIFNAQLLIISTLGPDATSLIAPSNIYNENLLLVILGHIAEGHEEHYVSLRGPVSQYIDSIQEAERLRIFPDPDEAKLSLGKFNRVSPQLRELTGRHLPLIVIRPLLSEKSRFSSKS